MIAQAGIAALPLAQVLTLALVAVAVVVDCRTGRGFGMGILSFLLLIFTFLVVVIVIIGEWQQQQPTSIHNISVAILLLFYFVLAVLPTLMVVLGAMIEAGIVGQWRWLMGLVAAAVVPMVVNYLVALLLSQFYDFQVGLVGVLVVPQVTALAYSVTRLVHPVVPAPARSRVPATRV